MPDLEQTIKRINEKLQQLLKKFSFLQKENEKLKIELNEIRLREKETDNLLQLLKLRMEVLKASKGEMTAEEKSSLEKKITIYLKEIDRCIALLNE